MNAYYIVDDVINETGKEGFVVMHGDPHTAVGVEQFSSPLFREAKAYVARAMAPGEEVYRVLLARRHKEHQVTRMHI